jgi:hypothetical protein
MIRTALLFSIVLLTQACATYDRSCAGFYKSQEYLAASDRKAIAQYFDQKSNQPPNQANDTTSECWFITDAKSPEDARLGVLEACNTSLEALGKESAWNCQIVVDGSEITLAERTRMAEIARTQTRSYERRSIAVHSRPLPVGAPTDEGGN